MLYHPCYRPVTLGAREHICDIGARPGTDLSPRFSTVLMTTCVNSHQSLVEHRKLTKFSTPERSISESTSSSTAVTSDSRERSASRSTSRSRRPTFSYAGSLSDPGVEVELGKEYEAEGLASLCNMASFKRRSCANATDVFESHRHNRS